MQDQDEEHEDVGNVAAETRHVEEAKAMEEDVQLPQDEVRALVWLVNTLASALASILWLSLR
jgi:hypothetical protein